MKRNWGAIVLIAGLFLLIVGLNFVFMPGSQATEEDEATGNRSSYRPTQFGALGLYTLLSESGYPVRRFEQPLTSIFDDSDISTLVIIWPLPHRGLSSEELTALADWVEEGGFLILVGSSIKLTVLDDIIINTRFAGYGNPPRPLQPGRYAEGVGRIAISPLAANVSVEGVASVSHIGTDNNSLLVEADVGEGRVLVLGDPYIVANNGIGEADNVRLALNLFSGRPEGDIAFDEYHHGYGSTAGAGVMAYFRGTPVPWMLAQVGLIAAFVVYTLGRRFGRPLPLKHERRTTNLEFVSSMANIARSARAGSLAMQNIYPEFHKRLCRFTGLPPKSDAARLASVAATRAGLDAEDLGSLLLRCESIMQGSNASDSELLSLVTRIRQTEARIS